MLKFTASSHPSIAHVWGGGHTRETDPTQRGWRCRAQPGRLGQLFVIGRRGVSGCASILLLGSGLDVAIYDNLTPLEVSEGLATGRVIADEYLALPNVPGWGLQIARKIEVFAQPSA